MKSTTSFITFILILNLALGLTAVAQDAEVPPGAISSFQAPKSGDRTEEAYAAGKRAVLEGNWQQALDSYSQVIKAGRAHVDEALYWQAYSQNKLRQRNAALTTIAQLKREYPQSKWLKDAGALEIEVHQEKGDTVEPKDESDCDLRLLAVNSLLNSDSERAVPLIEKLLNNGGNAGQCKGQILEKALFVLSQSDSARAHELMMQIGMGKLHPELQMKAIHYIGIAGDHDSLVKIYGATTNPEAKKAVLHSLGISGGCSELGTAVQKETDSQLLREAIHSMGIGGCKQQIRDLYAKATNIDVKREILHSTIISGDTELQEKVALSDADPKLKTDAIKDLGISGADSAILTKIYQNDQNADVRDAVINALFIKGDAHALVEMGRKEANPELKKRIVQKLSIMGNREATDYLMEILNK